MVYQWMLQGIIMVVRGVMDYTNWENLTRLMQIIIIILLSKIICMIQMIKTLLAIIGLMSFMKIKPRIFGWVHQVGLTYSTKKHDNLLPSKQKTEWPRIIFSRY